MKEIIEYIDRLEERHKTYLKLIERCLREIEELEERIEKLENE